MKNSEKNNKKVALVLSGGGSRGAYEAGACQALAELGIEFDIIEDYGLAEAECLEDGLRIGQAVYKHIYIPKNKHMKKEI